MGSIANPPEVLSANRCEPGSFPLRMASFPTTTKLSVIDPTIVAEEWIQSFNTAIKNPEPELSSLFLEESYWRDQLCLTWDFHTLAGPEKILELIQKTKGSRIKSISLDKSSAVRLPSLSPIDADGNVEVVGAFLTVETDVGSGEGLVRLVCSEDTWKAFTLFTTLKKLHSSTEAVGKQRPHGAHDEKYTSEENWLDRRMSELKCQGEDEPTVLIVGAGQAGLTIAARLKVMGIKSLVIDREKRVGDSWRQRYHQLVLHDVVWFDHLPYIPFPETWPVFTPKDKLADWFESYARTLELNIWNETNIDSAIWDEASKKWKVTLDHVVDGEKEKKVMHTKHIIQATGASGEPNFPSYLKGLSSFSGSKIIHSSQYTGSVPAHGQGKRAVVVGSCNSSHDIAQDFYNKGYQVTMVQRSTTCVVGVETMRDSTATLYGEDAPPTEDADLIFHSVPNPVLKRMNYKVRAASDEKLLSGLEKAGFKLDMGPDESGLWLKYLQRGGGYYLDVGCSQLIIDDKIKIKHGTISEVLPIGLKFDDGNILEADEIVFATGYLNMRTQTRNIFGDEIADSVKDVWGFDEEGEIRTLWRNSGRRGFWFMGGNLALCRWYSRLLALQIKGLEEGVYEYDDI